MIGEDCEANLVLIALLRYLLHMTHVELYLISCVKGIWPTEDER